MHIAQELISDFKSVRSFFPQEKNKRITWYDEEPLMMIKDVALVVGRKPKGVDIETRVEEMQTRLLPEGVISTGSLSPVRTEVDGLASPDHEPIVFERHDLSKELFRGLEFEKWFYIFVQVTSPPGPISAIY
jgi:hypothetical protein